jgi:hypothetical protein
MKNSMKITGLVIGALALAGCGTFKHKSVTGETGTLSVIAAKSSDHLVFVHDQNKTAKRAASRISCAMPSPDFLDASSTTGSLGGGRARNWCEHRVWQYAIGSVCRHAYSNRPASSRFSLPVMRSAYEWRSVEGAIQYRPCFDAGTVCHYDGD